MSETTALLLALFVWNTTPDLPLRLPARAVCALGLGAAGLGVGESVAEWRLARALSALAAAGHKLRLADAAPPGVPEEQNAAPLLAAAFAKLVDAPPGVPLDRARADGVAALRPAEKAALRAWLESNGAAFELVARARARTACRFPRDWSKGWAMELPELAPLRRAAQYLALAGEAEADRGRMAEARAYLVDAVRLAETLREEPVLISQLVRAAIYNQVFASLERASRGDPRGWGDVLPAAPALQGMTATGLEGELAMSAQTFASRKEDFWLLAGRPSPALSFLAGPLVRWDAARCLEIYARLAGVARRPYPEAAAAIAAIEREVESRPAWLSPVTRVLLPALSRAREHEAKVQARRAATAAGLACEESRAASGRWPERVTAADPFTGRPLVYRPDRGLVYSVGPNGRDDGGAGDDVAWKLRAGQAR